MRSAVQGFVILKGTASSPSFSRLGHGAASARLDKTWFSLKPLRLFALVKTVLGIVFSELTDV